MAKRKLSKNELRFLAHIASSLPEIPMKEVEIVSGAEILSNEKYASINKEGVVPKEMYKLRGGEGTINRISQKKQLQRVYLDGGLDAVEKYYKIVINKDGLQENKRN